MRYALPPLRFTAGLVHRLGLPIALVVALGAGCAQPPVTVTDSHARAIRDSVTIALAQFEQYSSKAQWDSLVTMYSASPAFRFLESGQLRYTSRQAVLDGFSALPPAASVSTEYRDLSIDPIAPGVAISHALFETAFSSQDGPMFRFGGALTLVWVHEEEGWRIRSGHSSSPVPRSGDQ